MHSATATQTDVNLSTQRVTPDGNLLKQVRQALVATGYPELQQVRVHVDGNDVALRGTVTTYYQKQLAQEAAMHIDGVESVSNGIVIAGLS